MNMANVNECETVSTRSKKRKLENEKDESVHYESSNRELIPGKAVFDTPDESMSERDDFKESFMSKSPASKCGINNKYEDKTDSKIKNFKTNVNNISGNKISNKLKSPKNYEIQNEETMIHHIPSPSIAETNEYYSTTKLKLKNRTCRNSLNSTPQKGSEKNKKKKNSLDTEVLNLEFEKFSFSPECKLKKNKIISKDDLSHIKSSKQKLNVQNVTSNIRTRSKKMIDTLLTDEASSIDDEMSRGKIPSSGDECSFNESEFENSQIIAENIMEEISPIKKANKFKTTTRESEEDFTESSDQSDISIKENVKAYSHSLASHNCDNISDLFSSETNEQSSKENYITSKQIAKTKEYSKSLKNEKTKRKPSQKVKETIVSLETSSDNSLIINETRVRRISKVTHKQDNKPSKGSGRGKSKISTIKPISDQEGGSTSEDSSIFLPTISSQSPLVGKHSKNTEPVASIDLTPKKLKSRITKKYSNLSEKEEDQSQQKSNKKRASAVKSPRTPKSQVNEEKLGLSWDKKSTPARRYSLRLKKADSESGTPRSKSIRHSSMGNTSPPSKRKKLQNIDLFESESGSDSDHYSNTTKSKQLKRNSKNTAANSSTRKMVKKLDIDSDLSCYSDDKNSHLKSRKSTPRKSAVNVFKETEINKSTTKKTRKNNS